MENYNMKSWKDLTLKQAQEIIALDPKNYDNEFLAYEVDLLSIILNQDPVEIEKTKSAKEILEILAEWSFLSDLPKEDNTKRVFTFKQNGKRYGLVDFSKMTLAQMVDIEEYVNGGLIENMHKIMSVLYLPTKSWNPFTKKYTLKEYEPDPEREEMFLNMDMEMVYGNLIFFYIIVMSYTKHIQDSLVVMSKEKMKEMMKDLEDDLFQM